MSKLLDIQSRIEKLPQLRKQKQNTAAVVAFTARIENAYGDMMECVEHRDCLRTVFPDEPLKATVNAVKKSKKSSAGLLEKLKGDFDAISSPATNQKIIRFKENNDSARKEINKQWPLLVDKALTPLTPLVILAQEAKLASHKKLVALKDSLESKEQPPETIKDAKQIHDELERLRTGIAELKLEGPGGAFLTKAVNGTADPKDLFKDEIREFLDEKDIWDILKVSLGS